MKRTIKTSIIKYRVSWICNGAKMWSAATNFNVNPVNILEFSTVSNLDKRNGWHQIDWRKTEGKVKDLQEKIVIATEKKDFKEVYRLQWVLIQRFESQALAIRKVITNKGGKTAGTDEIVWKGSQDYWDAIQELNKIIKNPKEYKATPLKRVLIPKANSDEKRPLGIPTMIDRGVQALYNLALDPVVETTSDPNSFGFRKCRSTHDAVTAIRSLLDKRVSPKWILEIDIAKCFDKIDHKFLMDHTPVIHRMVLEQWLKSGVMEQLNFVDTTEGTPQGGIISPTLCNVALNGIEEVVLKAYPLVKGKSQGVHLIRYADDMIVTCKERTTAGEIKKIIEEFLSKRGLTISERKTKITSIFDGFDFLGFNFRRMKVRSKFNSITEQDTILIIKPSEKGIKKLKDTIREIIKPNKPMTAIVREINPVLRGWAEHKRISYHSLDVFIKLDHWIYTKMMRWARWGKLSLSKTIKKNVIQTANRKWNWGTSLKQKIINLAEVAIIKLRPLKLYRNPYVLANIEYFNKRREKLIDAKFKAAIFKKYKNICPSCGESLNNGEPVELHHIVPQSSGGKYSIENIQPLHRICHQQTTHELPPLFLVFTNKSKNNGRRNKRIV